MVKREDRLKNIRDTSPEYAMLAIVVDVIGTHSAISSVYPKHI